MTTNRLEADAYSKITTTILGGVKVTHQLYGVYCHTWAPLDPSGAELRLRDQSGHDAVQDTGGNVHGDQLPTTITSMWADKDIFQALLHSDDYIVLTTHPHNEKLASQSILLEAIQVGQSRWGRSGTMQSCAEAKGGRQKPHVNPYRMFIKRSRACRPIGG